jgi:alpha-ribazole phosphatase
MPLVHLIRHAAPSVSGVILGRSDLPLAHEDIAPSTLRVRSICSSPLQRAHRTAELLFPQRAITIVNDLAEIGMGEWEEQPWEQIEVRWPEMAQAKLRDWAAVTPPGGEPWPSFQERIARAWQSICTLPDPIAIVAHAGVNAILSQIITGADPFEFAQSYEEGITLEVPYHAD